MDFEIYTGESIADCLTAFGCPVVFVDKIISPQVIRYFFKLKNINKNGSIKKAIERLALEMPEHIRQGNSKINGSHFCVEIEREKRYYPRYFDCCEALKNCADTSIVFGVDDNNEILTYSFDKMPHLLVAGATGSGKSVFLNNLILNICHFGGDTGLVLIDPKQVEFTQFEMSSHLACPIITDTQKAINVLNNLCDTMDERYTELRNLGLKDNSKKIFPKIVVVIDELADLMLTSKAEVETPIVRLAQKGRACGIHLVLATQRPTVNVITGLIKANIPCRIAFSMASNRDSIVLLDHSGANELMGNGDCLVKLPDRLNTIRIQAPFVQQKDIDQTFSNSIPKYKINYSRLNGSKINKKSWLDKLLNFLGFNNSRGKRISHNKCCDINTEDLFSVEEQNNLDCIDD